MEGRRRWIAGGALGALVLVLWAWGPASDTAVPAASPTAQTAGLEAARDRGRPGPTPRALAVRTGEGETAPPLSDAERERRMLRNYDGPVVRCTLEWQDLEGEPIVTQGLGFYVSKDELGDDSLPRMAGASATGLTLPEATASHLRSQAVDGHLVHELSTKERLVFRFTEQGCEVDFQTNEVFEVHCSWPTPEDVPDDLDLTHPVMLRDTPHTVGAGPEGAYVSTPEPEGSTELAVTGAVWRVHWKMGLCSGLERVE